MYSIYFSNFFYKINPEIMEIFKEKFSNKKLKCCNNLVNTGVIKKRDILGFSHEIEKLSSKELKFCELIGKIKRDLAIHLSEEYISNPDLFFKTTDIYFGKYSNLKKLLHLGIMTLQNFEISEVIIKDSFIEPSFGKEQYMRKYGHYPKCILKSKLKNYCIHDFDKTSKKNILFPKPLIESMFKIKIKDKLQNFSKEDKYTVYMIYYKYTPSEKILSELKKEIEKHLSPDELRKVEVRFWASRYPYYDHHYLRKLGYDFEIRDDIVISW